MPIFKEKVKLLALAQDEQLFDMMMSGDKLGARKIFGHIPVSTFHLLGFIHDGTLTRYNKNDNRNYWASWLR